MKKQFISLAACAALSSASLPAFADFEDLLGSFSNELEEQAAVAALENYLRLVEEAGCRDDFLVDPGATLPQGGTNACTGRTFEVFENVREIVHTGNELTRGGPTLFSLGASLEGLGFALRWFAAEEYAAQGDMSGDFSAGQVAGISARLTALRFGARGFQFANNGVYNDGQYANVYGSSGGAASSDFGYSRLGGFVNVQFGNGSREPTGLEDAFDMEMLGVTGGLDYRVDDNWIAGFTLGYSEQEIDFDSALSIVDGGIKSDGYSLMPFVMYQYNNFYASGSLGMQSLSFDSVRAIRYPSFNPDIDSTNTETISTTDASVVSMFAEVGYSFHWKRFSAEPYINYNSNSITIDEFVEDDINDEGFDLVIEKQNFDLADMSLGVKLQGTFTLGSVVLVPYTILEQVNQLEDAPRTVNAYYAGLPFEQSTYQIPTEELDGTYNTYNFGVSAVLRGGREKEMGGTVAGDVQGFFNIKNISGLDGYDLNFYSFGLRVAF